jgi:hypothetical protein
MDINENTLQKMIFVYNAVDSGWSVTKTDDNTFIFKKPHLNDKRIFLDTYLSEFITNNFDIKHILNK